jgi:hypothetical protein
MQAQYIHYLVEGAGSVYLLHCLEGQNVLCLPSGRKQPQEICHISSASHRKKINVRMKEQEDTVRIGKVPYRHLPFTAFKTDPNFKLLKIR